MPGATMQVVLGASGGAGHAITRALHEAGLPTRAVSRSGGDVPDGVASLRSDIEDAQALATAVEDAAVVYMAAQPPYHRWPERFPSMLESVVSSCIASGARLVMVDNLYMYGPGHDVITEDVPRRATDAKGETRAAMFDMLIAAHRRGDLRVAIGQASDYFGPRSDNSAITTLAVAPVARSGPLRWLGSLDTPHSAAYLPDIARAYVTLGTSDIAEGRSWILPHGAPVTGRTFIDRVNACLDAPRTAKVVSTTMLRVAAPFHRISRDTLPIIHQWTQPWVADDAAFQASFGPFATTPHDTAVAATVDWYRSPG